MSYHERMMTSYASFFCIILLIYQIESFTFLPKQKTYNRIVLSSPVITTPSTTTTTVLSLKNNDFILNDEEEERAQHQHKNMEDITTASQQQQPTNNKKIIINSNSDNKEKSVLRRMILQSIVYGSMALPSMAKAATEELSNISNNDATINANTNNLKVNVIKAPLDNREYESYTLDNGLRVLLCSDPTINSAAAAMDVHVGATSDPPEIPGLAHFCEHMLFLGTKEYPQEDSFSSFLSSRGGFSNAFTDSEDTVYYFEIDGYEDLNEGLKRFGSFFSNPLFTESATDRELNAIESENAKNLQSDIFRMYQIEKSRANSKHPFSKFYTGNKSTLLQNTKRLGINLRLQLIKFYETYYSSNLMTFAIIAPQPISKLKEIVNGVFENVPNRGANGGNMNRPEVNWKGVVPFSYGVDSIIPSLGYSVEIVPVMDLRQISFAFPILYESDENKEMIQLLSPSFYISHLIGHEGRGSLLSYLKKKGWANGLASSTNTELSDFETFEVTVELTTKGLNAIDDVSQTVFSYINMLRKGTIPDYTFDEVLNLSELEWRFLTKGNPGNYAQSLATNMQKYPPSLYVAGPRRLGLIKPSSSDNTGTIASTTQTIISSNTPRTSFSSKSERELNKKATSDFLSNLTVNNVMLTVLSKSFEGQMGMDAATEKWYGTSYRVRSIPPLTRASWDYSYPGVDIFFPLKNRYIPSESGLRVKKKVVTKIDNSRPPTFEEKMIPVTPPKLIREDGVGGRWNVYFKQDDRFDEPKAFCIFQLLTSKVYKDAKSAILASLYQESVFDSLNEYTYDARLAGLSYDIQVLPRGVRLTFGGYNDKLTDFAVYIAEKLAQNPNDVLPQSEDEFERYRDNLYRGLKSFDVKQPYSHSSYYAALLTSPPTFLYNNAELRSTLQTVSLSDLKSYAEKLYRYGNGQALIQGNLNEKEALSLVDKVDSAFQFVTGSVSDRPAKLITLPLPLVPSQNLPTKLKISEPNASNQNSASQVVIQCLSRTVKDNILIELLSSIIDTPFYEDLRTKQQLGYIVSSGVKAVEETRTLSLIVQSSVAPSDKLTTEILKFLDNFRQKELEPLTDMKFSSYIKGMIDRKTEPDKRLASEATRNWAQISTERLQFNRVQLEAAALLSLTKDDLLGFWDKYFARKNENGVRILISEIIPQTGPASSNAPMKNAESISQNNGLLLGIDNIESFRNDARKLESASVLNR